MAEDVSREPARPKRILFLMWHRGYVRNFEWLLQGLAERGHAIHLAFMGSKGPPEVLERLERDFPQLTSGPAPAREDGWRSLVSGIPHAIDYVAYSAPEFERAGKLRRRMQGRAPAVVVKALERPLLRRPAVLERLRRILGRLDSAIPTSPAIDEYLRRQDPDLLLAAPLVGSAEQADWVRSARAAGIHVGLVVTSWDNLTNKGLLRPAPDRTWIWNEGQRAEAEEIHGLDPSSVEVVGAHTYDHWFGWSPGSSREEFLERVGLPADRPLILYLCSSKFIARNEPPFVRRWLEGLRSCGLPELAGASVLVRPHPMAGWRSEDTLEELGAVRIYPPGGAVVVDGGTRSDYYDSIFHSAAVVGINTSAIVESTITGRPSFTMLDHEFRDSQDETLHFKHLVAENQGPLRVAETLEEHYAQLESAITGEGLPDGWNEPFLRHFIRPHGLDVPAGPIVCDSVTRLLDAPRPEPMDAAAGLAERIAIHALRPLSNRAAPNPRRRAKARKARRSAWKGRRRRILRARRAALVRVRTRRTSIMRAVTRR